MHCSLQKIHKDRQQQCNHAVCARVCVPYGAVVCAVDFQSRGCGFNSRRLRSHTSFFSFSFSWVVTNSQCMPEYVVWCVCVEKEKKE